MKWFSNDAVLEFMKRRSDLADYFDVKITKDIFDYIPPQKTNQIFTPKRVVKDMVDRLEKEILVVSITQTLPLPISI